MSRTIRHAHMLAAGVIAGGVALSCSAAAETGATPAAPLDRLCGTPPVPGKRVVAFGQRVAGGRLSKGVVIRAAPGAHAYAPCDGLVVYQGRFRRYGNLVVLSVGGGYHVLLAGLSNVDVETGQSVSAGTPIGTLSSAKSSVPSLTIELRKDTRAIDPALLWRRD